MKRASSSTDRIPKRIKHSPAASDSESDLFPASLERSAIDLLNNGSDGTGHLRGRFFMAWKPVKQRLRAILEVISEKHYFEVEFTGICAEFFEVLQIKAQDDVLLSLRGANVEKLANCSRTCNLPMKLQYAEGVVMKFGRSEGTCRVIDTWRLKESAQAPKVDEDDWFSTPSHRPRSPSPMIVNPGNTHEIVHISPGHKPAPDEGSHSSVSRSSSVADPGLTTAQRLPQPPPFNADTALVPLDTPTEAVPLSKKEKKRLKKVQRALERAAASATTSTPLAEDSVSPVEASVSPVEASVSPVEASVSPVEASVSPVEASVSPVESVNEKQTNSSLPPPPSHLPKDVSEPLDAPVQPELPAAPGFKAGLITATDAYHPLGTVKAGTIVHLICVATSVPSPTITRKGDPMCSFTVVDPTNISDDMMSNAEGLKINCFTKKYPQWLPQPSFGEVLILRNVKITEFNYGVNGVGYHDKLQWAIYSPSTGKVRHGDMENVPTSECLANGLGYKFSPFFHPEEREIRYCLQISDWWTEVQKKRREAMGEVHQIGQGVGEILSFSRSTRKHRLICEAGPEVPPQGYFDCTVEILHKYLNDNHVLSLYVTDYTANVAASPVAGSWCSSRLSDLVFKIEVWDAAVDDAMDMAEGDYYSIKNVRARLSNGGYLEGKLVEPKTTRLDDADASYDVHLKALLERKKAWNEVNESEFDSSNQFEYRLIKDAEEKRHFNCVVEVLHIAHGQASTYIYVTDYTSRAELFPLSVKESWGHRLDGSILKIQLCDQQVERAKALESGAYYKIKNLSMKYSVLEGHFVGHLGSDEVLIQMLNTNNPENKELTELIRRKGKWKEGTLDQIRKPLNLNHNCTTIQKLKSSVKCPSKFDIRARIIAFDPPDLIDVVILHCANCKQDIPRGRKACIKCCDIDHEYVRYLYQMYVIVQDDEDQTLLVSVNNQCRLFKDLKRTDVRTNSEAYRDLKACVSPILGNLLQVHEDMNNGVDTTVDTPLLTLVVYSWQVDGKDDHRAYGLWDIEEA